MQKRMNTYSIEKGSSKKGTSAQVTLKVTKEVHKVIYTSHLSKGTYLSKSQKIKSFSGKSTGAVQNKEHQPRTLGYRDRRNTVRYLQIPVVSQSRLNLGF
jgi:hypothetical protein